MNGFLKWFFVFMSSMLAGFGQIFKGLWNGIKQIFNIKNYIKIFKTYSADFGALGWILSVLAIIVVVAIFVLIIFMIVLAVRKYIRFRHSIVSNEDLIEEISDLQRQVVKMTKEKDEIMAMKVAQLGVYDNTALAEGETKLADACTGRSSNHCGRRCSDGRLPFFKAYRGGQFLQDIRAACLQ